VLTADKVDDMLRIGAEAPEAHVHPDDLAVLIFTSGTAGAPRAAMLSHANLLSNIRSTIAATPMHADDLSFGVLPMFHIFGLNVMFGCVMATGGTIVLVERFDPASALETIVDRGVTVMAGAPAMWAALAQMPGVDRVSMSTVRLAVTGAAKMPEDMASLLESKSRDRSRRGLRPHRGFASRHDGAHRRWCCQFAAWIDRCAGRGRHDPHRRRSGRRRVAR